MREQSQFLWTVHTHDCLTTTAVLEVVSVAHDTFGKTNQALSRYNMTTSSKYEYVV